MDEPEHTCRNCDYWEQTWNSCYNGNSAKVAEFTKPYETCHCWELLKSPKARQGRKGEPKR